MKLMVFIITMVLFSCKTPETKKHTPRMTQTVDTSKIYGYWEDQSPAKLNFSIATKGRVKSENMKTLLYEKWEIDGDSITFTVKSIGNKTSSTSQQSYKIAKLGNNEMVLITDNGRVFTYQKKLPTTNITIGQIIASPLLVEVNSRGVWHAHEGELGRVEVIDANGTILNNTRDYAILHTTDGDWMKQGDAYFSTTVTFKKSQSKNGKIIIYNNPGPGDGEEASRKEKIEIPIRFR